MYKNYSFLRNHFTGKHMVQQNIVREVSLLESSNRWPHRGALVMNWSLKANVKNAKSWLLMVCCHSCLEDVYPIQR